MTRPTDPPDELRGLRARPRPTGDVDERVVTTTDGAVPVPGLPDLEADVYLRSVARDHGLPVLLTRLRADDRAAPVARAATAIGLVGTDIGARLECPDPDFETLAYPVGCGHLRTSLSFWREVPAARHPGTAPAADRESGPAVPGTVAPGATER